MTTGPVCLIARAIAVKFALAAMLLTAIIDGQAQHNIAAPQDLVLTAQDDNQVVSAIVGQRIQIQLAANPSTGFSWSFTVTNGDAVAASGDPSYVPNDPGVTGGGGINSFPFLALKTGAATLAFVYRQPWNPQGAAQVFTVTIQVGGAVQGPQLSIATSEGKITIKWPSASSDGFYLEGTPNLALPQWAALNALALPDGPNLKVTLGTGEPAVFFRLRR
jgi:predicted secreted protein